MPLTGQKKRDYEARRSRAAAKANAEIGQPPARNQERWERYQFNLFLYLTECFPHTTGLKPFSLHHRRIIDCTQQILLDGGLDLQIVFRAFGKSTISENAAIWATGYGHRRFVVLVAADNEMARTALDSIQSEFETNDHLLEIFPSACHAARALEGVPQRAGKQTIGGTLTNIQWTNERCVLPTVDGFEGSGAIIWPKGITGNLRGLRFKRPDGAQARPDFYLCDDLQSDESAASPAQVHKRLSRITKTILRGGGHHRAASSVVLGTIIENDDVMDQLSNSKLFPAWRAVKVPMLLSFAKSHDTHWLGTYADLRNTHDPDDDDDRARAHRDATAYYLANQIVMDEGAQAAWESCFIEGEELSAIQHAYNCLIDMGHDGFMSECMNAPVRNTGGLAILTPDQICAKQSGYARDQFPPECGLLTTFIDPHPSILYWQVWGWSPDFVGYCVDYGTLPDQRRKYFSHTQLARRLQHLFPGRGVDSTVTAGLDALVHGYEPEGWPGLLRREWLRTDGVPMRIGKAGIDANGEAADAVKKFIRQSEFASILHASYGRGISAKQRPISQWQQSRGRPCNWPEAVPVKGKAGEPSGYLFDSNYIKLRFHRALSLPAGSKGALYLFKTASPNDHRLIADHWYAEKPCEVTVGSRSVYEFAQKPGTDNHYLDVACGCMVAAGIAGISSVAGKIHVKPRLSLKEMSVKAARRAS